MPFTTTWAHNALNRVFRNTAFSVPATIEWAPYSVSPGLDGTGGTEITTGGAARKTVTWAASSSAQISNNATVLATPPGTGATADWPLNTHFALHIGSGGAMIAYGPVSPAKQVNTAASFSLLAGEIQIADVAAATNRWLSWWTVNQLLTELTGGGVGTWPASIHWALFTAFPSRDGSVPGTEVTGTGYARLSRSLSAAAGRAISPSSSLDFGSPGGPWGEVRGVGAYTASTGGNLIGLLEFDSSVVPSAGVPFVIPSTSVAFTLS